jgi:MFS family permease
VDRNWLSAGNAAVIPIVGYLSDRIGSKTIFLLALGVFVVGSALCAVASGVPALTAFRIFQGLGGGALLPVGMAMIFRLFGPAERAAATSLLMIPILLGPAFGPTLGGLMLAVASSIALVYSFTQAGTDGWSTPTVIGGVLAGGALLVAFVLVELRVADPVMDLHLFRSYTFTIANLLAWVSSAVFFAGLSLVPFFSNGWNIFPLWRRARS